MNEIRVAVLASEPLGYGSGKHYFPALLNGYTWESEGVQHRFVTTNVYDEDLIAGRLTRQEFDVLLVPGGGVGDGEAVSKAFRFRRSVRKWHEAIQSFVKDGGGYVGICGGSAMMSGLLTDRPRPRSLLERTYDESDLRLSAVKCYYKALSLPLLTFLQRWFPERVGATAYVFSFEAGETTDGQRLHAAGVPVDFELDRDSFLFSGWEEDHLRMRWWGGPALVVPAFPDRPVKVLARYPSPDFSQDPRTRIRAWRFTGGTRGKLRALRDAVRMIRSEDLDYRDIVTYWYYLAGQWERTDKPIELEFAGRPAITAEVYPNANEGRIVLSTPHPEYMVWWGGHIEEAESSEEVCLGRGMRRWKDIAPLSDSLQKELTYTWWVVRRMTAWAGKVPDSQMPPIELGEITEEVEGIIEKNIRWDGSLLDLMHNI